MTMYFLRNDASDKIATESNIWRGRGANSRVPQQYTQSLRLWCTEKFWRDLLWGNADKWLFTQDGKCYQRVGTFHKHHVLDHKTLVEFDPDPDQVYWSDVT